MTFVFGCSTDSFSSPMTAGDTTLGSDGVFSTSAFFSSLRTTSPVFMQYISTSIRLLFWEERCFQPALDVLMNRSHLSRLLSREVGSICPGIQHVCDPFNRLVFSPGEGDCEGGRPEQ